MEDAVSAAEALAPVVADRAGEIERGRRLPPDVARQLVEARLFRLCVPASMGGLEADPATLVRAIEALSRGDGSAGWCLMVGATSGVLAAYLPEPFAEQIYGPADAVTGGTYAPKGVATPVDGGHRVTGRWQWGSGSQHCTWLLGGAILPGDRPEARLMFFPASDVEIVDTWRAMGMRGSGSHDLAVDDVFVPEGRSVSLVGDTPRVDGPLYRFPVFGLLALGIAGVALGVARAAVDDLLALATVKTPTGSARPLAARAVVQADVARAEAQLRSARAFLLAAIDEAWRRALTGSDLTLAERAQLRMAATHATAASADVVDVMYRAAGGTAVYDESPLQRRFRDVHVATQHLMVSPSTWELTGRVLLGVDADTSQL